MSEKRIYNAFDNIKASDALKNKTKEYLHNEIVKRESMETRVTASRKRVSAVLAVCVSAIIFGIGGLVVWFQAVSFISIDVNPSIELSVNRWERVVGVKAYDENSEDIANMPLKGKKYEEALSMLIAREEELGFLGSGSLADICVSSYNHERQRNIVKFLTKFSFDYFGDVVVKYNSVSMDLREEANQHNISTGKYRAILKLHELNSDGEITDSVIENYKDLSINELYKRIDGIIENPNDDDNDNQTVDDDQDEIPVETTDPTTTTAPQSNDTQNNNTTGTTQGNSTSHHNESEGSQTTTSSSHHGAASTKQQQSTKRQGSANTQATTAAPKTTKRQSGGRHNHHH